MAAFTQPLLAVLMIIAGVAWTISRFEWGQRVSPFRYRRNYPWVQCASCGALLRVTSRYCHACGVAAEREGATLFCGHCGVRNRQDAAFCTQCGDRFLGA